MRIVVFDAKPYDVEFFEKWNEKYGAKITYFKEKLSLNNVMLTKYQDVVCTFVNDDLNEKVINILAIFPVPTIPAVFPFNTTPVSPTKLKFPSLVLLYAL